MFVSVDHLMTLSDESPVSAHANDTGSTGTPSDNNGKKRNEQLKAMVAASLDDGDSLNDCFAKLVNYDSTKHTPPLFSDESEPQMKGGDVQSNALRFIQSIMKSINQQRKAKGLPPQAFHFDKITKAAVEPTGFLKLSDYGAEKYDNSPPPIAWLVKNVFRLGAAYLDAGQGDIGKGFQTLDLAFKVSLKKKESLPDAFGSEVMVHGQAVIISCEDAGDVFHHRLAKLDPLGLRHKYPGRLMPVPLPDAGGTRPFVTQSKAGLIRTPFYDDIRKQLLEFEDLKLIVFDTLQGLFQCDFNADPAAGQFCAGVLQELATVTGACVIACHHMKKAAIKSPAEAREAIRGTTAIVDGLRGAYALWPAPDKDAKTIATSLGKTWVSNLVVNGAIVKANSAESKHVATFVRNEFGLLEDCTNEIKHGGNVALRKQLYEVFRDACFFKNRFFKTGKKGVDVRRDELPKEVQDWGRIKLQKFVQQMADDGMIGIDSKVGIYVL